MTLAALAPSRASTVRIRPTETARCRLDAFTHRRNPRPHRGGGHLRGWRTIPIASVRADAAERTADGGRDRPSGFDRAERSPCRRDTPCRHRNSSPGNRSDRLARLGLGLQYPWPAS